MSEKSLSNIPFWDRKAASFGVYISKIEAYVEFVGIGDALDPVLIENSPAWLEFVALVITMPDNQTMVDLYKANKKLCMIIALGKGTSHGMALLSKTKKLGTFLRSQKIQ
jgi:hypothetical protein